MTFLFIVPLVIFVVAVYMFRNSADEMAYLAVAISIASLVLSLILAPWQIKLSLLAIALLSIGNLWLPTKQLEIKNNAQLSEVTSELQISTANSEKESQQSSSPLLNPLGKMVYRGVNYEQTNLAVKISEGEIQGKYRGQIWKSAPGENPNAVQPTFELKYRGASLNTKKSAAPAVEETK